MNSHMVCLQSSNLNVLIQSKELKGFKLCTFPTQREVYLYFTMKQHIPLTATVLVAQGQSSIRVSSTGDWLRTEPRGTWEFERFQDENNILKVLLI